MNAQVRTTIFNLLQEMSYDPNSSSSVLKLYFSLRLIAGLSGQSDVGAATLAATPKFEKFNQKYLLGFPPSAFTAETERTSFFQKADLLLTLFSNHGLMNFRVFLLELYPWLINDPNAYWQTFPAGTTDGTMVTALYLLLTYASQYDIPPVPVPEFFLGMEHFRNKWIGLRLIEKQFQESWMAVFSCPLTKSQIRVSA